MVSKPPARIAKKPSDVKSRRFMILPPRSEKGNGSNVSTRLLATVEPGPIDRRWRWKLDRTDSLYDRRRQNGPAVTRFVTKVLQGVDGCLIPDAGLAGDDRDSRVGSLRPYPAYRP